MTPYIVIIGEVAYWLEPGERPLNVTGNVAIHEAQGVKVHRPKQNTQRYLDSIDRRTATYDARQAAAQKVAGI